MGAHHLPQIILILFILARANAVYYRTHRWTWFALDADEGEG